MPQLPSPLDTLPTTRRAILVAIKIAGESSADTIAADLGISPGATRQHLTAMRAARLVDLRELREGPGRPRHLYFLSAAGHGLFPRSNAEYLNGVLIAANEVQPGLADTLLMRMGRLRFEAARPSLDGQPLPERMRTVVGFYQDEGFLPILNPHRENQELTLHHCPIFDTAQRFGAICNAEAECVSLSLDVPVSLVEHRLRGDRTCRFALVSASSSS